ncbi:pseudouridine synthase [Jeongeupia wiesaeckerbachi]|uniref:23S rRNA pseudouridine(2605) synthase RluB n=1 Tax=Jeongeupia wiesaeckerbachi TaxID=3051218 RepID=UPI003D80142A
MKTTRARRPQPAIREQKAADQQRAGLKGRKPVPSAADEFTSGRKPRGAKPALGQAPRTAAAGAAPAEPARGGRDIATKAKRMRMRAGSQHEVAVQKQLRAKRLTSAQVGEERLQKALAFSGVGSRRDMEELIAAGRVSVNGKIAELGAKVKQGDEVRVDGKRVTMRWADRLARVVLYHKQEGELVTRDDPQGRLTVFDRLPRLSSSKWVAVGRLDFNTSGLLIFTTSGDLANRMTHPRFEMEREYAVRVLGELSDEQIAELRKGITLEDGPAKFTHIEAQGGEGTNHWYRVVLKEGRNREVRRMFEHFGLTVSRLMRVRFGALTLPGRLKRGQFYELSETEVLAVMKWADLKLNGEAKDH